MKGSPFTKLVIVVLAALSPALAFGRFSSNTPFPVQVDGSRAERQSTMQDRGGPVTNGLQVFIEGQRAPIPEDQPIAIVFRVTNLTARNFDFGWCRSSWQPNFTVAVTTERGEPLSKTGAGEGMLSFTGGRIGPGQEHVEIGDLREQYELVRGRYYVTAIENFDRGDNPPLPAPSNTIEITVSPASRGSSAKAPRLVFGQAQWVFDPPGDIEQGLRLTNLADSDVQVASGQGQPWFHDVTLDFRTLSGEPVPLRRGADGQELSLEKDGWGPHRSVIAGPLQPGDYLYADVLLSRLYRLRPGTAYTLTARMTLQTSDGPVEAVSNTVTFVIKAR